MSSPRTFKSRTGATGDFPRRLYERRGNSGSAARKIYGVGGGAGGGAVSPTQPVIISHPSPSVPSHSSAAAQLQTMDAIGQDTAGGRGLCPLRCNSFGLQRRPRLKIINL